MKFNPNNKTKNTNPSYRSKDKTGEDIDMLHENEYERKYETSDDDYSDDVCDKSVDGA